jgi:hypothetical protein
MLKTSLAEKEEGLGRAHVELEEAKTNALEAEKNSQISKLQENLQELESKNLKLETRVEELQKV